MSTKIKTTFYSKLFDRSVASELFLLLRDNIGWVDGIKSRKSGFTRKQQGVALNAKDDISVIVLELVHIAITRINEQYEKIAGIYLNYYRDGNDFTPNHTHPGMKQLVISLGAMRSLEVGNEEYRMKSGDAIIFGSAAHGVPKSETKKGRISIAVFINK